MMVLSMHYMVRRSGENREPAMLRSKYADAQVPTEVELLFENGGQEYKVRRNPEYERPAKKGGGMTLQRVRGRIDISGWPCSYKTKRSE